MKIIIAKSSGFCMGVRRAVEMALNPPGSQSGSLYTYGPLIHNPQVLKVLQEKEIQALDHVPDDGDGTVLIRAHGVPPETKDQLSDAGFQTIDATCPRVIKIQKIIKKYANQQYRIIIIGNEEHPEVIGLLGYTNGQGVTVDSLDQLKSLPAYEQAIVVSQTTQNLETFKEMKDWLESEHTHYQIFETICDSTEKRQAEVQNLAHSVDAVVVVGGYNSGNTRRLAEIAETSGKPVYHIETEQDFTPAALESLSQASTVGITAGASTPNWIIKQVQHTLEQLPCRQRGVCASKIRRLQRLLLITNAYIALGAGCLSFAGMRLLRLADIWACIAISILYVQSIHLFNHLTGTKADRHIAPDRAAFYERHKVILLRLALATGGAGLLIALSLGLWSFLLLLLMTIAGMSYNLRLFPQISKSIKHLRIKDIPGSKTVFTSVAWGVLASILPSIVARQPLTGVNLVLFACFTSLVFVRTAFFDILDMQGNRFIGKETIAILLGEKRIMRVLNTLLLALLIVFPLASLLNWVSSLGYSMALCPLYMVIIFSLYKKGHLQSNTRLEFLIESLFMVAGIITVIWPVAM